MEGGGCPTNPGRSSFARELPNKGKAAEKANHSNKGKGSVEDNDGSGEGTQAAPAVVADAAMAGAGSNVVREQDRLMPIANINRIMRKVLPTNAKIAEDAKETVQGYVSEFITHVTSEANERCRQEQRKTVTAEDVLWALGKLGFDQHVEYLSMYLHNYRLHEGDNRPARRDLLSPAARAVTTSAAGLYPPLGLDVGALGHSAWFFTDEGGSSSAAAATAAADAAAAAAAGGVIMPEDHQRNVAGTRARRSQGPQLFGFDPFARYN